MSLLLLLPPGWDGVTRYADGAATLQGAQPLTTSGYHLKPPSPSPVPALHFNAAADRLSIANFPNDHTSLSLTMWVRRKSTNPDPAVLVSFDSAGVTYDFGLNANVLGLLDAGGGFVWRLTLGSALAQDQWFFIGLKINGTTGHLYLGDRSTAVSTTSGSITSLGSSSKTLYIGGEYNGGFAPVADLALVRLWDAQLSDAEFDAERQSKTPARSTNLAGDWRLVSNANKLVDSSPAGSTLTAPAAGPWEDVADGPQIGPDETVAVGVATLGNTTGTANGVFGSNDVEATGAATLENATGAAAGHTLVSGAGDQTLQGATATAVADVGQGPIDWSVPMPRITGRPYYGTGADLAAFFDDGYGYADETWAVTAGSWAAVDVGAGPSSLLIGLSHDDASGGSWISSSFEEYRIQVSNDSTNGADGTWTTLVTVTGNTYRCREHVISFTGYSWVKLIVDASSQGQLDEFDIWDASAGTNDTFAFVGDSVTDTGTRRYEYFGGGLVPSFQDNVLLNQPGHYPLQVNLGASSQGASYWAANIDAALALHPAIKYWCVSLGLNDAFSMPSALATFRTDLTYVIDAIIDAGKIPVLAGTTWTGAAGYGGNGNDFEGTNLKYLNDEGIDYVANATGVRRGPDLYQLFFDNRVAFNVVSDPHPIEVGYRAWSKAWADSFGISPGVEGTANRTLEGVSGSADGVHGVSGTGSATAADSVGSASGTAGSSTSGSGNATLEDAVGSASGTANQPPVGLSDSLTVSEGLSASRATIQGVSETVSLSENLATLRVAIGSLSESVSLLDNLASGFHTSASPAESVAISDAVQTLTSQAASVSEGLSVVEEVLSHRAAIISIAESDSLSDSVNSNAARVIGVSEELPLFEALIGGSQQVVSVLDNISLSEGLASLRSALVGVSESPGWVESSAPIKQTSVDVNDSVSLIDAMVAEAILHQVVVETVTLVEALESGGSISVGEVVSLTDSLSSISNLLAFVSETVSLSEELQAVAHAARNLSESVALSEGVAGGGNSGFSESVEEFLTVAESLLSTKTSSATVLETVLLTEALQVTKRSSVVLEVVQNLFEQINNTTAQTLYASGSLSGMVELFGRLTIKLEKVEGTLRPSISVAQRFRRRRR